MLAELTDRYGEPSPEVLNLLEVAKFRLVARAAGLSDIVSQGNFIRFGPAKLQDSRVLRLNRLHPRSIVKEAAGIVLIPRPLTAPIGGEPVRDRDLLDWCTKVVSDIFTA